MMKTRGRPRHPDILTPRQWEVLALVRQGLTNEEIAERLGVTLDGAKFHVSEIIRKLGVDSRYAAAAWQPPAPTWVQRSRMLALAPFAVLRRIHWNALTYTIGAAATIGVIAVTALLAWGVTRTRGDGGGGRIIAPIAISPTPVSLTGVAAVDATIGKLVAHDIDALVNAAQFTPVGCSIEQTVGSPPKCATDAPEGTLVDTFFESVCEGFYLTTLDDVRSSFIGRLSHSDVSSIFAVMRGGIGFSTDGYVVVLTPGAHTSATAESQYWTLAASGRIEAIAGGCGLPGAAQEVNLATPNAAFVAGPFISCSRPPGEYANLLVTVDGLSPGSTRPMFWGTARSTLDGVPPLDDHAIVEVTPATLWTGDLSRLEDARTGMTLQATGRVQDDCTILAESIISEIANATPSGPPTSGEFSAQIIEDVDSDGKFSRADVAAITLIELLASDGRSVGVYSRDDGGFRFSNIPDGEYTVRIWWPGFVNLPPSATVAGDHADIAVTVDVHADRPVTADLPQQIFGRYIGRGTGPPLADDSQHPRATTPVGVADATLLAP